ncbi:MAG: hypothetical protein DCE87_02495 [Betaproteobacteria bacterium]|jgi:hypothetical protein|nr:MAG: hypothetical protein DCE87_02495 [Betaproteobacteria bacterium]PZO24104.1 MAG: hypothetical protein DCE89_07650 [Betaproteobacteria bacterium]PZO29726.1 MAG: hypothetical protein DCE88_06850 [Betaproteobacteria bacterium]
MQSLKIFLALIFIQISVACSKSNDSPLVRLHLQSKTDCELVFKAENFSVIENFCSTEGKPILIRVDDQEIRSDWIDERTSRFLFQEGCASSDECFYELSTNEVGVRGRFSYRINMTEGEYSFEVDKSGQSKVFKQSSKDIPS